MTEASKKSIRLYKRAKKVTEELEAVRRQIAPLHTRLLRLQDKSREAFHEMNASFAEDGFTEGEGWFKLEGNRLD